MKGVILCSALAITPVADGAPTLDQSTLEGAGVYKVSEATALDGKRLGGGWWLAEQRMMLIGNRIFDLEQENSRLKRTVVEASELKPPAHSQAGFWIGVILGTVVTSATVVYVATH